MTQTGFKKAVKIEKALKMALIGASGSGKTYTGLALGTRIAELRGGRLAVIDTERGSASLYADRFDFDVMELDPPYTAEKFVAAVLQARSAGYKALLVDSLSHFWAGSGGILELVDNAMRGYGGNKYYAWADGTPKHNAIVDTMIGSRLDVIATMRTRSAYVEVENPGGRKGYEKAGTQPIQRDGIDFEFDLVIGLTADHVGSIDKGRFQELDGRIFNPVTSDLADELIDLLKGEKPKQAGTAGPAGTEAPEMIGDIQTKDQLIAYLAADEFVTDYVDAKALPRWVDYVTAGNYDPRMNAYLVALARDYVFKIASGGNKAELAPATAQEYQKRLVSLDAGEEEE